MSEFCPICNNDMRTETYDGGPPNYDQYLEHEVCDVCGYETDWEDYTDYDLLEDDLGWVSNADFNGPN